MSQEEKEPWFQSYYDAETGVLISSEIPAAELELENFRGMVPQVSRALATWAEDVQTNTRSRGQTIFGRDKFNPPNKMLKVMETAGRTIDDDIVSNVLDTSESLTFRRVHFEMQDKDQEDVWNQMARDVNLDKFIREAWRDLYLYSQFTAIKLPGIKDYKVRGRNPETGNKRRKEFQDVRMPQRLSILDPIRVVPVGRNVFGDERLAWIADPSQMAGFQTDPVMNLLFVGTYNPSEAEKEELSKNEVPVDRLLEFNPEMVWRHTLTKAPYERWAPVRMKSVFPLLDLKNQLREMDRTWLLGGINFIVLVKRGSDTIPARPIEVQNTSTQFRSQSKAPVIITDHRIDIEIITPDVQHVLNNEKWRVIDDRLLTRLWGLFQFPSSSGSSEDEAVVARVIARGLESRRHMLKRSIEENIIRPVVDDPINDMLDEAPKLQFTPRRMELEYDASVIQMLQSLRDRGDISRETILSEFNFDQSVEAERRQWEDEMWEDVFKPVNVPFDSKDGTTPDGSGRTGGRPGGSPDQEPREQRNDSQ